MENTPAWFPISSQRIGGEPGIPKASLYKLAFFVLEYILYIVYNLLMERTVKPWGWYEECFSEIPQYKVKRIYVNPESRFSLQSHNNRNEYWTVVQGDGTVEVGENYKEIYTGDFVFIPKTTKHRLKGGSTGITLIEVQHGDFCLEEDIERFEDDFGRI